MVDCEEKCSTYRIYSYSSIFCGTQVLNIYLCGMRRGEQACSGQHRQGRDIFKDSSTIIEECFECVMLLVLEALSRQALNETKEALRCR